MISTLRAWFSRPEGQAPAWYRAQRDPVVGAALRMLQNNPAHPWSVESLAKATNVSRAALARRFNELVGEPPMTFLTGWRLDLAADLLCETDATIGAVAEQVGYGSPFALSTAFKRVLGVSPQQHRLRRARAGVLTIAVRRSCPRRRCRWSHSSMRMNEPVARLRAYGSKAIGFEVRRRTRPMSLRPSSVGAGVGRQRVDVDVVDDLVDDRPRAVRRVLDRVARAGAQRRVGHPADGRLELAGRAAARCRRGR